MDFLDAITAWGSTAPERVAHESAGVQLTYGALVGRAATLARWIDSALPYDRRPIDVLGHREPQLLVAMLACALTNHPYVPIDDGIPAERVARIATAAAVPLVIRADDVDRHASATSPLPPRRARAADDLFYIMFTSGSSGEPKGVQITRGCLAAFIGWMTEEQALQIEDEVVLNQANFSFDLSVMDLYLSLVSGGTLVSATRDHAANPRLLFGLLRTTPITTWVSTPTFAAMCLPERSFDATMLPTLRRLAARGAPLVRASRVAAVAFDARFTM